jgi:hypothetical protein
MAILFQLFASNYVGYHRLGNDSRVAPYSTWVERSETGVPIGSCRWALCFCNVFVARSEEKLEVVFQAFPKPWQSAETQSCAGSTERFAILRGVQEDARGHFHLIGARARSSTLAASSIVAGPKPLEATDHVHPPQADRSWSRFPSLYSRRVAHLLDSRESSCPVTDIG